VNRRAVGSRDLLQGLLLELQRLLQHFNLFLLFGDRGAEARDFVALTCGAGSTSRYGSSIVSRASHTGKNQQ